MKLSHIAASIALIAAAGAAQAAGGLSVGGVTGSGASTSFSITQGGNTQTVNMGITHQDAFTIPQGTTLGQPTTTVTLTPSSFTNTVGFDAANWQVTGGLTFNAASTNTVVTAGQPTLSALNVAAYDYVSQGNVNTFVTGVAAAINGAVTAEVGYIGTQVALVGADVVAYNAKNYDLTTEAEADGTAEGTKLKADFAALNAEVDGTRNAINTIKGIKLNSAVTLAGVEYVVTKDANDVVGAAASFKKVDGTSIVGTGGNNTISASGAGL